MAMFGQNLGASPVVSDPGRYAAVRRWTIALGSAMIAAFVALGAFGVWRSYVHAVAITERELGNVATALAYHASWSMRSFDLLLRNTARWYLLDAARTPAAQINGVLRERAAEVPAVYAVTIVDSNGIERYSSSQTFSPGLEVSLQPYFTVLKSGRESGMYVGAPFVSRTGPREAAMLAVPLEEPDGRFAGIVTATLDLDPVQRFYKGVNFGAGSAFQQLRSDGTLLLRIPALPGVIGHRFPSLIALAGDWTNAAIARVTSPIDNERDFIAAVRVRDAPLVIAITRTEAAALQSWREEALRLSIGTLGVMLLGGLGIAALVYQLRRVELGERALRQSEERYALVLEGANAGHWDLQIVPHRLFVSPKLRELHGLAPDTPLESRAEWQARIPIHPDDAPRLQTAVAAHLAGETQRYELEYRVRHPDGQWHWVLARGHCLRDERGQPVRFVGSTIDISDIKQSQADKERLEFKLRQAQKMEAIGTLAGGIAHDFNNILGAIVGHGELAQERAPEGSILRRHLDSVMHAAERARVLIDRILGFARGGTAERVPVNMQKVLDEVVELLRASLPANVRLETNLEAANLAVIGDATRMHQVAMNLCTNAVQAMRGSGGTLRVGLGRVDLEARRTFSRGELPAGPYLRLTVSDTGCGIPAEVVDRVFEPFFTTKRAGEGTGLGLSLVHGIVADLGGVIELDTVVGRGTTVSIWLPMSGAAPRVIDESPRELPRGDGEVVLIVDDEAPLVSVTEEMLAELGYDPVGVVSSTEALQVFRADPRRFDVVVTDEMMPGLIGTELAREVSALQPGTPVILMTGHGGDDLAERAGVAGVRAILRKPLQKSALADALARVLGARLGRARAS